MFEADYKTVVELLDKSRFFTNPRNSNVASSKAAYHWNADAKFR